MPKVTGGTGQDVNDVDYLKWVSTALGTAAVSPAVAATLDNEPEHDSHVTSSHKSSGCSPDPDTSKESSSASSADDHHSQVRQTSTSPDSGYDQGHQSSKCYFHSSPCVRKSN